MGTRDRIIEKYLEADAEKRLYLFLDCPSLRNEFIEIDLAEYRTKDTAKEKTGTAPVRSFLRWWRTAAANCCPIFRKA